MWKPINTKEPYLTPISNETKTQSCLSNRDNIESLMQMRLTFSLICWFNGLSVKDKNSLNRIVRVCSRITGVRLSVLWKKNVVQKAKCILEQGDRIKSSEFTLMPSGWRYYAPLRKTNRYSNSFIPSVIQRMNANFNEYVSALWFHLLCFPSFFF